MKRNLSHLWLYSKRYDVKEWLTRVVYSVNQKFKDCNLINASPYAHAYTYTSITIWDHPFKTSACLRGGGVSPFADGQKVTVHKDQKSPS